MSSDLEQLQTIRSQALASIAEITANQKPSYTVDGQSVSWNAYLRRLRQTVDWCDRKLAGEQLVEFRSQATS
jgi:hypothetical protein